MMRKVWLNSYWYKFEHEGFHIVCTTCDVIDIMVEIGSHYELCKVMEESTMKHQITCMMAESGWTKQHLLQVKSRNLFENQQVLWDRGKMHYDLLIITCRKQQPKWTNDFERSQFIFHKCIMIDQL